MKKYCVSWISFHDNELSSSIIEAPDLLSATKFAYFSLLDVDYEDDQPQSIVEIKQAAFDCDGMVNAIEV